MQLKCLASSSEGNCYYIKFDNSASLLVEVGLPIKQLKRELVQNNLSLNFIDAILISHQHKDHSLSANELLKLGKKVYGNKNVTKEKYILKNGVGKYITKDIYVIPFEVKHDVENFGYIIKSDNETVLFVTDCKYFEYDLSDYAFDYILIECNYSAKIVHTLYNNALKNNDKSTLFKYERLLNSHMSERNCLRMLKTLNLNKCKSIFLIHLSDAHANEMLFKKLIREELKINCCVCKKKGGIN